MSERDAAGIPVRHPRRARVAKLEAALREARGLLAETQDTTDLDGLRSRVRAFLAAHSQEQGAAPGLKAYDDPATGERLFRIEQSAALVPEPDPSARTTLDAAGNVLLGYPGMTMAAHANAEPMPKPQPVPSAREVIEADRRRQLYEHYPTLKPAPSERHAFEMIDGGSYCRICSMDYEEHPTEPQEKEPPAEACGERVYLSDWRGSLGDGDWYSCDNAKGHAGDCGGDGGDR